VSWQDQAACQDADVEFFPHDGWNPAPALAVCADCPVKQPCFQYARRLHINEGVWGGHVLPVGSDPMRFTRSPCGTPAGYRRHRRAREEACLPCADAHWKAKNPSGERRRRFVSSRPLVEAVEAKNVPIGRLFPDDNDRRAFFRARRTGEVSVQVADRLASRLGVVLEDVA
jgi:hypothetical protein